MRIEIAYAEPEKQYVETIEVGSSATIAQVLQRLGVIPKLFPHLKINPDAVGIFGRRVPVGTHLEEGDRIELYRPLLIDPKEARQRRDNKSRKPPDTC